MGRAKGPGLLGESVEEISIFPHTKLKYGELTDKLALMALINRYATHKILFLKVHPSVWHIVGTQNTITEWNNLRINLHVTMKCIMLLDQDKNIILYSNYF